MVGFERVSEFESVAFSYPPQLADSIGSTSEGWNGERMCLFRQPPCCTLSSQCPSRGQICSLGRSSVSADFPTLPLVPSPLLPGDAHLLEQRNVESKTN